MYSCQCCRARGEEPGQCHPTVHNTQEAKRNLIVGSEFLTQNVPSTPCRGSTGDRDRTQEKDLSPVPR